jgi:hypothetical protein
MPPVSVGPTNPTPSLTYDQLWALMPDVALTLIGYGSRRTTSQRRLRRPGPSRSRKAPLPRSAVLILESRNTVRIGNKAASLCGILDGSACERRCGRLCGDVSGRAPVRCCSSPSNSNRATNRNLSVKKRPTALASWTTQALGDAWSRRGPIASGVGRPEMLGRIGAPRTPGFRAIIKTSRAGPLAVQTGRASA